MSALLLSSVTLVALLAACGSPLGPEHHAQIPPGCELDSSISADSVPLCLYARGIITAEDRDTARLVLARAGAVLSFLNAIDTSAEHRSTYYMGTAISRIPEFYANGNFADSARFHRMLDHVSVTIDYVQGTNITWIIGRAWPSATPYLSWLFVGGVGIYFQPVNTQQGLFVLFPDAANTDSLLQMGEQMWRYALWRKHHGLRFPVWEYEFDWTSNGIAVKPPWVSSLAQGMAIELFAEAYRRTGNRLWLDRAMLTVNSYRVSWNDGGVRLPDTTHGYWWEEYHPDVQVWNGSVQAAVALGYLRDVTGDLEIGRMYARAIDAIKYYTPLYYDTGSWTLYARNSGPNPVSYHNYQILLLDALYGQTRDPWFSETAARWRTYTSPF